MTYEEALAAIASLEPRGWRLGQERMERFVMEAGLADSLGPVPRYVHVAGTNGKGSVTAYAQAILTAHGVRTGGFFSPYVVDPRERVQIDGELIDKTEFARLATELWPIAERVGEVTEFEFKTALGFAAWRRAGCAWVALEVGLGGRFDATNVVTPAVSVIASISLDHTSILGNTEGEIAFEKAGVIKSGAPVVVGRLGEEAMAVALRVAEERGAVALRLGSDVKTERDGSGLTVVTPRGTFRGLAPADFGAFSDDNAALAVGALVAAGFDCDPEAVRRGVAAASLPGRMTHRTVAGRLIILDGAHNPGSATALTRIDDSGFSDPVVVANGVTGHDAEGFFRALLPRYRSFIVPPIQGPRARPPEETAALLRSLGAEAIVARSVEHALDLASGPTLVTGSFYLVGEALRIIDQPT